MSNQPTPRILNAAQAMARIEENARHLDIPANELSNIAGHDTPEKWAEKIVQRNRDDRIAAADQARGPGF